MSHSNQTQLTETQEIVARISFSHRTEYNYSGPVSFSPHRFVLRPREDHLNRLESMTLVTEPASKVQWSEDIEGNIVALAEFSQDAPTPHCHLRVHRCETLRGRFFQPARHDAHALPPASSRD